MSDLRRRVRAGERVAGMFLDFYSPDIVEMIGRAGHDFVVLDAEHGSLGPREIRDLTRAADVAGLAVMVRADERALPSVTTALDAGAVGWQATGLRTRQDVAEAVSAVRYPPAGSRSTAYYTRRGGFGLADREGVVGFQPLVGVQIESPEALDLLGALDDLAVDVAFLGPVDYAMSLRGRGGPVPPTADQARSRMIAAARGTGWVVGTYAASQDQARQYAAEGCTYLTSGATPLLARSLQVWVSGLTGAAPDPPRA